MNEKRFSFIRKQILVQLVFFLGLFRSIKIFGPRGVICPSDWLTITGSCRWSNVTFELLLWAVAILLLILELVWDRNWKGLWQACRANWLVFVFIGLAGLSLIWSIQFHITLYKFFILLVASIIANYIGHVFDFQKLVKSLWIFFTFISLLSLMIVIFFPDFGIESIEFFRGSWNGIFLHRNYLGVFMALGTALFLVNLLYFFNRHKGYFYLNFVMMVLSSTLLIKSKSATGIISGLVLVVLIFVLLAWINWGKHLKPIHYLSFLGLSLILFVLLMANLNFFLGLFGRNASLTGRVPMWEYLFQNVINQRPWLGHGFGVIWHLEGFVKEMTQILNWGVWVMIGDNGFIDILLHLGVVGVLVLLLLMIMGFIRATRYFLRERTIMAAFPIVVLVFVVVANISLSLILEIETLVWFITLATLVSVTNKSRETNG